MDQQLAAPTREQIVAELRKVCDNYDYFDPALQESLITTRMSQYHAAPSIDDRAAQVERRFFDLAKQHNLDVSAHHGVWSAEQSALAQRLRAEAEASIPAPVSTPSDDFVIDAADPLKTLRVARAELDEAVIVYEAASLSLYRGTLQRNKARQELATFDSLQDDVVAFSLQQIKAGTDQPLPHHLESAQRERSRASDRVDRADAVVIRLEAEKRHAEANRQLAQGHVRAAATACCFQHAERIAAELAGINAQAHVLEEQLTALAYTALGGTNGASPLPHTVRQAINEPRPTAERREPLIAEWRKMHHELMTGNLDVTVSFDN